MTKTSVADSEENVFLNNVMCMATTSGLDCKYLSPPDTSSRPFRICICSHMVETNPFSELVIFTDYALRISLGTFSISLFLETLHTILQIFLHQRFWTTINRFSLPSEYRQPMKSSICHTFIGFQRCTKIPINTDSLRVPRSVRPSLYPFYSPNCLHILSKVFRSTAKQPTPEVGSIRCGSSRIQKNY